MAFVKPEIKGKEIKVALAFHVKQPKKERKAELPALIAELADDKSVAIAASAYAPVEPDFARDSPFDSLIKADPDTLAMTGPTIKGDHPWAKNPLPKSVSLQLKALPRHRNLFRIARRIGEGPGCCAQVILNR